MLPPKLRLEGVQDLQGGPDGTVVLIFNDELLKISGGHNAIDGVLRQIVFTATEIHGIKAVRFKVFGHESNTLVIGGEGYTVDRPLSRADFTGEY